MAAVAADGVAVPAAGLDGAVPAGQLACQKNSYLRRCSATVLACTPAPPPPLLKKKGGKKAKAKGNTGKGGEDGADGGAAPQQPDELWHVRLTDTVLFPEGGGQPFDRGTVGGTAVVDVQVVGGFPLHTTVAPLEVGSEVEVVVDWARRWDHMQQHTGQHLITATAAGTLGFPTVGWCLGVGLTSSLDLGTEGQPFTDEMLTALEAAVNDRVRAGHAVGPTWIGPKSPEMATVRKGKDLPDDVVGDVRVLTIEGVDQNLCCGTHVQTTAHLAAIKLLRAEKVKKTTRLHFVVGDRLLALAGDMFTRQHALTAALAAAPERHLEQVNDICKKARDSEKRAKALGRELAEATADRLVADAGGGKTMVVAAHREAGDIEWMKATLAAAGDRMGQVLVLLTCGTDGNGMFMLAGPPGAVSEMGPKVAALLEGRGGGKGRFQGKVAKVSKHGDAVHMLEEAAPAAAAARA
mmetsp:Transcript_21158/g.55076  ORF Transcript_21158/g.55076 Transcript_21158/m.55076 type:complete len:465 (-) Transcript_21158:25-1419(-)